MVAPDSVSLHEIKISLLLYGGPGYWGKPPGVPWEDGERGYKDHPYLSHAHYLRLGVCVCERVGNGLTLQDWWAMRSEERVVLMRLALDRGGPIQNLAPEDLAPEDDEPPEGDDGPPARPLTAESIAILVALREVDGRPLTQTQIQRRLALLARRNVPGAVALGEKAVGKHLRPLLAQNLAARPEGTTKKGVAITPAGSARLLEVLPESGGKPAAN